LRKVNEQYCGLNQSEPFAPPEVVNQTDTFNEAKIPQQVETSEASKLSQISDPAKSTQETKLTPPAQASEPSNTLNENLNQDNVLVPLNNSTVSNIAQQSNTSSETDAKDLTKKESWKEWTCRQWKDNKWYWIGGVIVVVGIGDVYYYRRSTERISVATQCCLRTNRHLPVSGSQLRNQIQVARIGFYEAEIDRLDAEILRLTAEIQNANT